MNKLTKGLCILLAGSFIQSSVVHAKEPTVTRLDIIASQERRSIYHARILKNMADQGLLIVDSESNSEKQSAIYLRIKNEGMGRYERNLSLVTSLNQTPNVLIPAATLAASAGFVLSTHGETKMESTKAKVFSAGAAGYTASGIGSALFADKLRATSNPEQWNAMAQELLQSEEYNTLVNHQISKTEALLGLSNNAVYIQNRVELISAFKTIKAQSTLNSIRENNDQYEVNFTTFLANKNVISAQESKDIQNIVALMALQNVNVGEQQPTVQNSSPISAGEDHVNTMLEVVQDLKTSTTKGSSALKDLNELETRLQNELRYLTYMKSILK